MKTKVIYINNLNAVRTLTAKLELMGHSVSLEELQEHFTIDSTIEIIIVYLEKDLHLSIPLESLVKDYSLGGARIIAIHSIDKQSHKVPKIIDQLADAIVCCDDSFIERAIAGEDIFVDAECMLPKKKNIIRHSC